MIYTTSLPVSQRINELIGEQQYPHWYWYRGKLETWEGLEEWGENHLGVLENAVPAFTLSELPEVLKKVSIERYGETGADYVQGTMEPSWYLYHYLKCCELHAIGHNVDDYLMELLK